VWRSRAAADTKSGLQVADITNPASPRIVGGVDPSGRTFDVAVSGSYAYVVNSSAGLYVLPTQCDPLTGVRGDDRFVSTMVLRVIPNPSSQGTVIRFETPSGGTARVAVYNAEGRFVRGLLDGIVSAGGHELLWDGRNREGGAVAAGVYFVHVSTVEGCRAVRCLRVR
jgi:hypothetical protein